MEKDFIKIETNYHTHTERCGHAEKVADEEYVLRVLKHNYKILGFSDHGALKDCIHEGMRMKYDDIEEYMASINSLKEKYKNKIKIYCGFEIEYYKENDDYYHHLLEDKKMDYLILGQHCYYYPTPSSLQQYFRFKDDIEGITKYKNDLCDGIKSGYFLYVCHPDLFFNYISETNEKIDKIIEEIVLTAIKYDLPLEINLNGYIYNREPAQKRGCLFYPSIYFFKKAKELGCNKYIFGIDAHGPNTFDKIPYEYLETFFKETKIQKEDILSELEMKRR